VTAVQCHCGVQQCDVLHRKLQLKLYIACQSSRMCWHFFLQSTEGEKTSPPDILHRVSKELAD